MRAKKFVRSEIPLLPPIFDEEEIKFNSWLAGFIDGDGYIYVSKEGDCCNLQLKQAEWNIHLLELLKDKLGGGIYRVKETKNTYVYHLSKRDAMINLTHCLNGHIRATSRNGQFKGMCQVYNIDYIQPIKLKPNDNYFAGFIDADGSLFLNNKKAKESGSSASIRIEVTAKFENDLDDFHSLFNGNVTHREGAGCYKWIIQSKKDILFAEGCFGRNLKSNKLIRSSLIQLFFELKEKSAYKTESRFFPDWRKFVNDWYDNGADIYRKNCTGIPYTAKARNAKDEEEDT